MPELRALLDAHANDLKFTETIILSSGTWTFET
jgi:hypothetical protein